ncbi:MAG: type II secretion system F family protein [Desulfobacterales bacterium]
MQQFIMGAIIFVLSIIIFQLIIYGYRNMRSPDRAKIRKRLRKFVYIQEGVDGSDILRKRVLSEIPFINRLLLKTPGVQKLDHLIIQANARYPMGFYILFGFFTASVGFTAGTVLAKNQLLALVFVPICGSLPFLYLKLLKQKRIEKFQKQLPDGLDLIARALKAGHAFIGGLQMAAEEFDDPLGSEFEETLDEINFGVSVSDALKNLAKRIDCNEIKYFVVGVILQRETGGNLAELVEILATLIRENFKFQGKVRTLSAEGKLSAAILVVLPFLIGLWIRFTNPEYMDLLITEPMGRIMLAVALIMMIIGIFIMKKMVEIKV